MDNITVLTAAIQYDTVIAQIGAASFVFVVYDYALTFPTEVRFVWLVKWTPGKVLFLVIRYLPFLYFPLWLYVMLVQEPNQVLCTRFLDCFQYMSLLQSILSETVVSLRTWALWGRRRSIAVLLVMMWTATSVLATFFGHYAVTDDIYVEYTPEVGLRGCLWNTDSEGTFGTIFLVWATAEAFIFILTLLRGLVHWRKTSLSSLITVLYRDAFLVSLAFSVLVFGEIILINVGQPMWAYAFNMFCVASKCVLPGRIILNLREAAMSLDGWDIPTVLPSSARSGDGQSCVTVYTERVDV